MIIAVDLPNNGLQWQIAGGIIQYVCEMDDIELVFPRSQFLRAKECDSDNWDALISDFIWENLDVPQVAVSPVFSNTPFVCVSISWSEAVKLIVKQFLSMGLSSFAFVGTHELRLGFNCFRNQLGKEGIVPAFLALDDDDVETTLMSIPKPCGIVCISDGAGVELLDMCRRLGLRVPGDIQVIAIGDSPKCRECSPTLSSVVLPFNELGYRAAEACLKLCNGEHVDTIMISPTDLIIRESVDVDNVHITTAAEIAHYLRSNFSYPIQMEDLQRRSPLSRRQLERLFRSVYGSSPIAYLNDLRFDHAKRLLEFSDLPIKKIAGECGYCSDTHFYRVFKDRTGSSPGDFRKQLGKQ